MISKKVRIQKMKTLSWETKPSQFLDYKLYLKSIYMVCKGEFTNYSYRQFAEDLGLGYVALIHQIVQGHRSLSENNAKKIAVALGLSPDEKKYLVALANFNNTKSVEKRDTALKELTRLRKAQLDNDKESQILDYLKAWYHPVIREAVCLPGFNLDPEWIAGQLIPRVTAEQVKESLALLQKLDLIKYDDETQSFRHTNPRFISPDEINNLAAARYHQQVAELIHGSVAKLPQKERDLSTITLRVKHTEIPKIKDAIRKFQTEILDRFESDDGSDEVLLVGIQALPVFKKKRVK